MFVGSLATGLVSKVTSGVGKVVGSVPIAGAAPAAAAEASSKAMAGFATVMQTLGWILFGIGAVMALYLPMVPFITWFAGLVSYSAVVVEGIIAAPLHALSHIDGQGEGMGQRAGHGYLFLLNVLFRPLLMTFGFLVGSMFTIALGTLLFKLYPAAMAGVQGNSVTGIGSFIGFICIFFIICNLIIQGSFNLIHIIPDQVLGWVGGHMNAHLGRELEGKVHGVFMGAVNRGQGLTSGIRAGAGQVAPAGGAQGQGGGGGNPATPGPSNNSGGQRRG